MRNHEIQDLLHGEFQKTILRYIAEFDISFADIFGVLECIKAEVLSDYMGYEDDDDDMTTMMTAKRGSGV